MFIQDDDFRLVASEQTLKAITGSEPDNKDNAILEAVEEIKGYLRPAYDCGAIFQATGSDRNRQLVMIAADIAIYHLTASMPQRMGSEVREERYQRAIKWLEGVQAGKISPDLPMASSTLDDGASSGAVLSYGRTEDVHSW